MATTPINGLPSPDYPGGENNPPKHIKALADALDRKVPNVFASEAARNAAIPAPSSGMRCIIEEGGTPYRPQREQAYRGGQWRDVSYSPAIVANLRNSGNSPLTNGNWAIVPFDVEEIDTVDGHSNTTNNSRWYAPLSGYYQVSATGAFTASNNTSSQRGVRIRRNGDGGHYRSATVLYFVGPNSLVQLATPAPLVYLAAGDFLDVQMFYNSTDTLTTYADANLATTLSVTAVPGGQ